MSPGSGDDDHRIELEFVDHVLVLTFDRPEARNAFDSAMYRAVAGALSGALGDEDVHAVVLIGRGKAFTSGQDLTRDGGHRHRRGRTRRRVRVPGPARPRPALRQATAGRRPRGGHGPRPHPPRPRRPGADRRVGPVACALRRAGRPARGGKQRPTAVADGVAAGGPGAAGLGVGRRPTRRSTSGLALRICPDGTVLAETLALARSIASFPPHATRQIKRLMLAGRGSRRRRRPPPARRRPSPPCSPIRRPTPGRRWPPDWETDRMRIGVTCFLTDRDIAPADLARAAEERGFASLYLPEHTHLPVRADTPPALVEGVSPDDYRRSLDPFVALATAASVTDHAAPRHRRGPGGPARPDRPGQAGGHPRPPERRPGGPRDRLRLEPCRGGRPRAWPSPTAGPSPASTCCACRPCGRRPGRVPRGVRGPRPLLEWPEPGAAARGARPARRGGLAGNFAAIAEYADGWMPVGGSGLAEALPGPATRLRGRRARPGPRPRRSPSAPCRRRPSSTTTPASVSTRSCCGSPRARVRRPRRPRRLHRPPRAIRRHRCLTRPHRYSTGWRARAARGAVTAARSWPPPCVASSS